MIRILLIVVVDADLIAHTKPLDAIFERHRTIQCLTVGVLHRTCYLVVGEVETVDVGIVTSVNGERVLVTDTCPQWSGEPVGVHATKHFFV